MIFKFVVQLKFGFSLGTSSPEKRAVQVCTQVADRRKLRSLLCMNCLRYRCGRFLQKIHGNTRIGKVLLGIGNGLRGDVLSDRIDKWFDGPAQTIGAVQKDWTTPD